MTGVIALVVVAVAVVAIVSVFRDREITGGSRALWLAIVLVLPLLGPAVYFGVRRDW